MQVVCWLLVSFIIYGCVKSGVGLSLPGGFSSSYSSSESNGSSNGGLSSEGLSSGGLSSEGLSSEGLSSEGLNSEGLSSGSLSSGGLISGGLSNGGSSLLQSGGGGGASYSFESSSSSQTHGGEETFDSANFVSSKGSSSVNGRQGTEYNIFSSKIEGDGGHVNVLDGKPVSVFKLNATRDNGLDVKFLDGASDAFMDASSSLQSAVNSDPAQFIKTITETMERIPINSSSVTDSVSSFSSRSPSFTNTFGEQKNFEGSAQNNAILDGAITNFREDMRVNPQTSSSISTNIKANQNLSIQNNAAPQSNNGQTTITKETQTFSNNFPQPNQVFTQTNKFPTQQINDGQSFTRVTETITNNIPSNNTNNTSTSNQVITQTNEFPAQQINDGQSNGGQSNGGQSNNGQSNNGQSNNGQSKFRITKLTETNIKNTSSSDINQNVPNSNQVITQTTENFANPQINDGKTVFTKVTETSSSMDPGKIINFPEANEFRGSLVFDSNQRFNGPNPQQSSVQSTTTTTTKNSQNSTASITDNINSMSGMTDSASQFLTNTNTLFPTQSNEFQSSDSGTGGSKVTNTTTTITSRQPISTNQNGIFTSSQQADALRELYILRQQEVNWSWSSDAARRWIATYGNLFDGVDWNSTLSINEFLNRFGANSWITANGGNGVSSTWSQSSGGNNGLFGKINFGGNEVKSGPGIRLAIL